MRTISKASSALAIMVLFYSSFLSGDRRYRLFPANTKRRA